MDTEKQKQKQILSAKEVAEIVNVGVGEIYDAIRLGELEASRVGGVWRIEKKNIKDWLDGTSNLNEPKLRRRHGVQKLYSAAQKKKLFDEEAWEEAVYSLSNPHRRVLIRRFGLDGEKPSSLEELGQELSKSCERIRQLQREALETLRNEMTQT